MGSEEWGCGTELVCLRETDEQPKQLAICCVCYKIGLVLKLQKLNFLRDKSATPGRQDLVIWTKHVLDRAGLMDFTLHSVFMANSHLAKVASVKFPAQQQLCTVLCETTDKWWIWVYTKMADVPEPGFWKYWKQELSSLKSECHAVSTQK
jgi:hypothetical protein